jgi:hypothetical protein
MQRANDWIDEERVEKFLKQARAVLNGQEYLVPLLVSQPLERSSLIEAVRDILGGRWLCRDEHLRRGPDEPSKTDRQQVFEWDSKRPRQQWLFQCFRLCRTSFTHGFSAPLTLLPLRVSRVRCTNPVIAASSIR